MRNLRIGIVGAGVGGLASAAFLARNGHDVHLLERFAEARPVGAGLLLQPTGLACLAQLGLDARALSLGAVIHDLEGRTARGRRVLAMDYRRLQPHLFGLGIHRGSLFALLHEEVVRLGVPIEPGVEASYVERHARQRSVVVDTLGRHHGPYDLIIDASGMRSPLRRALSGRVRDRQFTYGAIWGALPITENWPHCATLMQRYEGAPIMIGVLPIGCLPDDPTPRCAFFWSVRVDQREAWMAAGLDAWKARVAALWPEVSPILAGVRTANDLSFVSYSDVVLERPYCPDQSLVVIGDGAHGTSPQLGQGANLALVDAMMLSAALEEGRSIEAALGDFHAQRRRHVAFYQLASRWLTPFFQSDSRVLGFVRDATFGLASIIPFAEGQMLRTLSGIKTGPFSELDPGDWSARYSVKTISTPKSQRHSSPFVGEVRRGGLQDNSSRETPHP